MHCKRNRMQYVCKFDGVTAPASPTFKHSLETTENSLEGDGKNSREYNINSEIDIVSSNCSIYRI